MPFATTCNPFTEEIIFYYEDLPIYKTGEFLQKLEVFNQTDWVKNQSFCFKDQSKVVLQQRIYNEGLCYTLNYEDNLFVYDQ
jgi:hypothetical protein